MIKEQVFGCIYRGGGVRDFCIGQHTAFVLTTENSFGSQWHRYHEHFQANCGTGLEDRMDIVDKVISINWLLPAMTTIFR